MRPISGTIYMASDATTEVLLSEPETGMGYQFVQAAGTLNGFLSGKIGDYVIINSIYVVLLGSGYQGLSSLLNLIKRASRQGGYEEIKLSRIQVFDEEHYFPESSISSFKIQINKRHRYRGGKGAKDAKVEYADGFEVFVRLSAFKNDRRIDQERKRLLPGSYTTTLLDYIVCKETNDDPIDRYALPNEDRIKWAFYLRPKMKVDALRRGVVQPAFGKEGGGLEALFEKGTTDGTLFDIKRHE